MKAELNFIGSICTPYNALSQCPNNIDPEGPVCEIHLNESYRDGLFGLEVGQHILILYWLGDAESEMMNLQRGQAGVLKGTFALRTPIRPNPIGAAVLPIEAIDSGVLTVRGLDCLNDTRLIDIKPAIYHEVAK